MLLVLAAFGLHAAEPRVAVVYPELGEPFRGVFVRIIEGVEEQLRTRVVQVAINNATNSPEVVSELRRQEVRVVITLGRQGLKVVAPFSREFSVIAAGLISAPQEDTRDMLVASLAPDPNLLFNQLKSLAGHVRRVFVVYDRRQNEWILRLAREAALSRNIELVAYDVPDLKTALRTYGELMSLVDGKRDALWLLQDTTTVEESAVLPFVLQEGWGRGLLIFSSNVNHVKRGALFALYPDNLALGRSLGMYAQRQLSGSVLRGVLPLKETLNALNTRTANHLGLTIDTKRQSFDAIFPEQ